jgi:hypothetical protein
MSQKNYTILRIIKGIQPKARKPEEISFLAFGKVVVVIDATMISVANTITTMIAVGTEFVCR